MLSGPWILHADMDAFYAAIEQRDHPELRGRPVIVGASRGRGVVAAASYEARRYGVRSAMPGFRARQLCPDGVFLPCNMARYAAVSAQIQTIFHDFTPLVEPLALDEAFLEVGGSAHLFGGVEALARELKRRVRAETGLAVSVGVAPNKLVAKIACNFGKPDGLLVVPRERVRELLDPLPIGWLWGVGPVLEQQLVARGITTFAQLAAHDTHALEDVAGRRAAELQALARGEDERPVIGEREPRSYGEENTFETDVTAHEQIERAIIAHADAVARRVRRDEYVGRTVRLKLKLARARQPRADARGPSYPILTRSKTLDVPTDDADEIANVGKQLWRAAEVREPIRLIGVALAGLERSRRGRGPAQLDLFAASPAQRRLGPTLDAIRERFGNDAIGRALAAPEKITHGRGIKRGERLDAGGSPSRKAPR